MAFEFVDLENETLQLAPELKFSFYNFQKNKFYFDPFLFFHPAFGFSD